MCGAKRKVLTIHARFKVFTQKIPEQDLNLHAETQKDKFSRIRFYLAYYLI